MTTQSREKMLVNLTAGGADPGSVLLSHMIAVEALRAGGEAAIALSKGGVSIAIQGTTEEIAIAGAPDVSSLQEEFVERGGVYLVSAVCVAVSGLDDAPWLANAQIGELSDVLTYARGETTVISY